MQKGILSAFKEVFGDRKNIGIFITLSVLFFILLVMVPVWTTPGNDFMFQLSLFGSTVLALMVLLSFGNGLLLTMQWYIHLENKIARSSAHAAAEKATLLGSVTAAFLSTIACAACYSMILSVFGLGTVAFFVEYRLWIAIGALLLTTFSLYYSAHRINHNCETCSIS